MSYGIQNVRLDKTLDALRCWYAVHTRSSQERLACRQLVAREIEIFLPQYRVVHRWRNRCTKTLELPLFPGYVFARISNEKRVQVLELSSVVSIVGTNCQPTPLQDVEIEALRCGLENRRAEPHAYLVAGQRVRICRGALTGLEGVVLRQKNTLRVVISLELIARSVAVEVDWDELEPCSRRN